MSECYRSEVLLLNKSLPLPYVTAHSRQFLGILFYIYEYFLTDATSSY
jgi:hypothetical protein